MSSRPEHQPPDLREYVRLLRAHKLQIGVIALLAMVAAVGLSVRQTRIYQGEAKVVVQPFQDPTRSTGARPPNLQNERELILSALVAQKAQQALHLSSSPQTFLSGAGVEVVTDTQVLLVHYNSPAPATAARLANGLAQAYVDYRAQLAQQQFQAAAGVVQKQITDYLTQLYRLNKTIAKTTDDHALQSLEGQRNTLTVQLGVLQQRLLDLESTAAANAAPAQIVASATVPTVPVKPKPKRNGIIGLFLGLALGVGIALLREHLGDRIKSRPELERRLGAPILAAVPHVRLWRKRAEARLIMVSDRNSPFSEAYRTLANNVLHLASQNPIKIIMVTSALSGEGKSTTAANLAVAMAESGKRVILVSADLRRSRMHQFFGLTNDIGFSDALEDSMPLAKITKDPGIRNLRVLAAGPAPSNPSERLSSPRAADILHALRDSSDFVILDTPPVLAVADTSILAPLADATLYVVGAENPSGAAIVQAKQQLDHAGANLVGGIYNNFDPRRSATYPYYYYYHYYHEYYEPLEEHENGSKPGPLRKRFRRSDPADANRGF